jgi:hypothetical protein
LLTQKYPFQTERIPLTITIVNTKTTILIVTCNPNISDQVSLINGAPLATHNHEHGWYISFHNTLQRLHTLPTSRDSLSARRSWLSIDHYQGDPAGYHYVAFTKIPRDCSRPLGFLNAPHSSLRDEPTWQSVLHTPSPINGTTAKRTTPRFLYYSAKGVPLHPHGCTVFPGGHPTNRSLRRGTRETARAPLNVTSITSW